MLTAPKKGWKSLTTESNVKDLVGSRFIEQLYTHFHYYAIKRDHETGSQTIPN